MSDMEVDVDKENSIPNFRREKYDGLIQDLHELNDLVSKSSDSVNDSDDSNIEEINIRRKSAIFYVFHLMFNKERGYGFSLYGITIC
jgi:hypothetical protein